MEYVVDLIIEVLYSFLKFWGRLHKEYMVYID